VHVHQIGKALHYIIRQSHPQAAFRNFADLDRLIDAVVESTSSRGGSLAAGSLEEARSTQQKGFDLLARFAVDLDGLEPAVPFALPSELVEHISKTGLSPGEAPLPNIDNYFACLASGPSSRPEGALSSAVNSVIDAVIASDDA
jgi:hypothetical protein